MIKEPENIVVMITASSIDEGQMIADELTRQRPRGIAGCGERSRLLWTSRTRIRGFFCACDGVPSAGPQPR